jgi:hypothetical protein
MNDTYVLSFVAGTSGRFLASILWNMINNLDSEIEFTPFNSAHYGTPWTRNWDVKLDEPSIEWTVNGPTAYNIFNFTEDKGIMTTHSYPNWDVIRERFPSTKVIIIQYDDTDIPEMIANIMYKNGFDLFLSDFQKGKDRKSMTFNLICEIHKDLFGAEYDGSYELTIQQLEQIFEKMLEKWRPMMLSWDRFIDTPVPDDFIDKTMILSYKNIFDTEETLSKFMNFTQHSVNDYTKESYRTYVNNRKTLLETKMPWIKI